MKDNQYHIIIVDDSMGNKDPFIVEMKLEFGNEAQVSYFDEVNKAMSFIDEHMSERMILFMDCRFGSVWQGVDAVLKLREKTSLIYVVMMSANNPTQLVDKDITALINTDNIFFIKNTNIDGAKEFVNKIKLLWQSKFDCILERWILNHPEDAEKVVYKDGNGSYTWQDILVELRLQSLIGKSIEEMVNRYYIYHYPQENQ